MKSSYLFVCIALCLGFSQAKIDFQSIGNWVEGAAKDSGKWISGAAKDTGSWVSDKTKDATKWTGEATDDAKKWLDGATDGVEKWASKTYYDVGNLLNDAEKNEKLDVSFVMQDD